MKWLYSFFLSLSIMSFLCAQSDEKIDSLAVVEINFALDSYRLTPTAKATVDSILEVYPPAILKKVEIYGHTDSLAGMEYNRQLSKRRVMSILSYFVLQGLDPLKVDADYYGEEKPKYDNSPQERFRNRRCEVILKPDFSLMPQPEMRLSTQEVEKGDKLRIPNLQFVGNQPIPEPQSFSALGELLLLMKRNPDLKIEIQGHVCCSNNQQLSEERAYMVYHFLANNGIDKSRLAAEGFSNSQPLYRELTERDKAMNRRVEVLVIENSERRLDLSEENFEVDLRAPVMGVKFIHNSGRLTPAGDFALQLIAESMGAAENFNYEFVVFDNIDDASLTRTRVRNIKSTLLRKKADRKIFDVVEEESTVRMPVTTDNLMLVHIKRR